MKKRETITFAVTACDEDKYLKNLLGNIALYMRSGDQILIQTDSNKVTPEVLEVVEDFTSRYKDERLHVSFPLNNDFATFKNNIFKHAKCNWIFQLDADEDLNISTDALSEILNLNEHLDIIALPRINIVHGITMYHVTKWKWRVSKFEHPWFKDSQELSKFSEDELELFRKFDLIINEDDKSIEYYIPIINFPDYQWRLYRNKPEIKWIKPVHERLIGYHNYAILPDTIEYSMMHVKEIRRQEKQNEYYDKIINDEY